jgi:hypothetical protein
MLKLAMRTVPPRCTPRMAAFSIFSITERGASAS